MKNSGVEIKSIHDIDLSSFDVFRYGGCSKAYLENNCIFKKFRENQSDIKRTYIYENILELYKNSKKIDKSEIVLPKTLYVDDEGLLEVQKMDYIKGMCGVSTIRKYYMTKKYYLIVLKLIDLIKKYTKRNFVIEDLKLSNIIIDANFDSHIIDNDFTTYGEIPNEKIMRSFFVDEYLNKFNDTLDPNYNLFNLYFMVAVLLLTEEDFKYAMSVKRYPSIENLKAINYFIQKDNGIPQLFKVELRKLLVGNKEISFTEDLKFDICEYILKRSK